MHIRSSLSLESFFSYALCQANSYKRGSDLVLRALKTPPYHLDMPRAARVISDVFPSLLSCALCVAALAMSGCANRVPLPPAKAPEVPLPSAWGVGTTAAPSEAAAPVDLTLWWRAFGDADLDDLVARALASSPDLQACGARARAVQAMAQEAAARLGPRLSLVGGPQQSADGRSDYFQSGLSGEWNLAFALRRDSLKGMADAELQSALVDEQAARATLVAEVARTYFEMRAAERDQVLLQQLAAVAAERQRLTRALVDARQVPQTDLDAAVADSALASAAAGEPAMQALLARSRLRVLLGDLSASLPVAVHDASAPARVSFALGALPADLVRQRPAVRRAEQSVLRAAHAAGLARADAQPQVSLMGFIGLTALVSGPGSSSVRGVLSAGPAFSIPLFDGGQREAVQLARHAEFDAAAALYRKEVLQGVAEAQAALLQLDWQRQQVAATAAAVATAQRLADAAEQQARVGLADGLQTADARAAAVQSRRKAMGAVVAEQIAYGSLFTAFGGATLPASSSP